MDTSTSTVDPTVVFALEGHKIAEHELSGTQWLQIVRHVLKIHKFHAKHFLYLVDHKEAVEGIHQATGLHIHYCGTGWEPKSLLYPDSELSEKTRLLPLIPLSPLSEIQRGEWNGSEMKLELYLLLRNDFAWVMMTRVMSRGENGTSSLISIDDCRFQLMTDEELLSYLENNAYYWRMILFSLQKHAKEVIERKQSHIREHQESVDRVSTILSRIGRVEPPERPVICR